MCPGPRYLGIDRNSYKLLILYLLMSSHLLLVGKTL
jgi:hypothetical protein